MPDVKPRGNPLANARIDRALSARIDKLAGAMRTARDASLVAAGMEPESRPDGADRADAIRACIAAGIGIMEIKLSLADAPAQPRGGKKKREK